MVSLPRSALLNSGLAGTIGVGVIVGAIVFGGFAASSGDRPLLGSTSTEQEPTPAATQTPTQTKTATPAATPTATPSDTQRREAYEQVRTAYLDRWSELPKDHPTIPELLGTEVRLQHDELWVVFDETDVHENASQMRDEWTAIANGYLFALDNHTGATPERMIAVGWNNTGPITHFRVETDTAQALIQEDIEYNTFYNRFVRTVRATNDAERSIARDIAEHPPDDN